MEARDERGDERAVEEEAELEVWRRRAAGGEGGGEDESVERRRERRGRRIRGGGLENTDHGETSGGKVREGEEGKQKGR